jgi:hypothetical protein
MVMVMAVHRLTAVPVKVDANSSLRWPRIRFAWLHLPVLSHLRGDSLKSSHDPFSCILIRKVIQGFFSLVLLVQRWHLFCQVT